MLDPAGSSEIVVCATHREPRPNGVFVYNLEVSGAHTYFISDSIGLANVAIWVHNACAYFKSTVDKGTGKVLKVDAKVTEASLRTGSKVTHAGRVAINAIKQVGDDAGHLIGKLLGGSGDPDNLVPQLAAVNRGIFRTAELRVKNTIEAIPGVIAVIRVLPRYVGNQMRPVAIRYVVDFLDEAGNVVAPRIDDIFPNI